VRRRDFLVASAAVTAGAAAVGVVRVFRSGGGTEPSDAAAAPLFPAEDEALLLAVADHIVPRDGDHPAASEIDLIPRLERWARASESRLRIYRRGWPALREQMAKVRVVDGRPHPQGLARRMKLWHRIHRRNRRARRAVRFFEQLRRDVLRAYYSSPAGWASVGYAGPVHRTQPPGERRA
jgi:hypothetical protein